jgi:glycosyltransferase involved in cell wall biosynthesis
MKILWIFSHPAPYKVDFFNELGKSTDLTVLFERHSESDRPAAFYCSKAHNFKCKFAKSIKIGTANNYSWDPLREIKKYSYDIIVVNGWSTLSEMKVLRYLHLHKIPYIFAVNGGILKTKESRYLLNLKRKYISNAALYLCPDARSAQYLAYYGAEVSRIRYYSYATIFAADIPEEPATKNEKDSLKKGFGLPLQDIYVSVGAFIPRKNELELLQIWTKVDSQKVLVLVGSGDEENTYRSFLQDHHLNNVIIRSFIPHEEILKFFRLAEASIFLTKEDIYGHVVNESLSQGTPVLASDNANSSHKLILNGINGYLLTLTDEKGIIAAINTGISDTMRCEALLTARKNTIEEMTKEHLEIFSRFLKL